MNKKTKREKNSEKKANKSIVWRQLPWFVHHSLWTVDMNIYLRYLLANKKTMKERGYDNSIQFSFGLKEIWILNPIVLLVEWFDLMGPSERTQIVLPGLYQWNLICHLAANPSNWDVLNENELSDKYAKWNNCINNSNGFVFSTRTKTKTTDKIINWATFNVTIN